MLLMQLNVYYEKQQLGWPLEIDLLFYDKYFQTSTPDLLPLCKHLTTYHV